MKEYFIVLLLIGFLYLIFTVLDFLHISFGLFILGLLTVIAILVLALPEWFVFFLYNLARKPKKQGYKNGLIVVLLYVIMKVHDGFWGFATKYYPFSLLYRDRFFHAKNIPVRTFIHELEAYGNTIHLPFHISGGDGSEAMALFWAKKRGGLVMKKDEYLKRLQDKLQEKYETIYVSPEAIGFTIHVPTSMVKQTQA